MLLPRCSARSPVDSVSTMVGIGIAADLLEPSLRAGPAPTEGEDADRPGLSERSGDEDGCYRYRLANREPPDCGE